MARALTFSPDGEKLAIGVDADVISCKTTEDLLKNHEDLKCLISEGERAGPVRALNFSPGQGDEALTGDDTLLVVADDASVRLLDAPTTGTLRSFCTGPIGCAAASP